MPEIAPAPLPQPSIISLLPYRLQNIVIDAVLDTRCERATDIWYQQQPGNTVVVLYSGVQWFLNESASAMWMRMDAPVRDLTEEWVAGASEEERREISTLVVDFLLLASANGLVTLFPQVTEAAKPAKPVPSQQAPKKG
jgi:hypothetical protein